MIRKIIYLFISSPFFTIGIIGILVLGHLIGYLLTKVVIWIAYRLFNVNWYGKFWVVYVAIIVMGVIFK